MPIGSLELVAIGVVLWTNAHQCTHVSGTHTAYTYANQGIYIHFVREKAKEKGRELVKKLERAIFFGSCKRKVEI